MPPGRPPIEFTLNGQPACAPPPPPGRTLLDELRSRGLTGAKEGCAEGECGACAVVLVAAEGTGSAFRAFNSCLMPLSNVDGHEIYTVEALAHQGHLSPPQSALAAAGGSQCGYCTPGFVMSLFAEYYRPSRASACDVEALAGNLCRCTGYRPIRDAVSALGAAPDDDFRRRLTQPAPPLRAVATEGFSRPLSVEACTSAMTEHPDAVIVAGATDLGVEANLKGRRPSHLVSLEAIDEVHRVEENGSRVRIGSAVALSDIPRLWTSRPGAVDDWLALFASPLIRNRATLGGNLATGSPIGDAAPLLLALDAQVQVAGAQGRRTVALESFFLGYRKTALLPGEVIVSIDVPLPAPSILRFYKVSKRQADDISTVAAAFAINRDHDGIVRHARLAFGGVAATPVRLCDVEAALLGRPWTETVAAEIAARVEGAVAPMSDHRGSATYRREVAGRLIEKFWWEQTA